MEMTTLAIAVGGLVLGLRSEWRASRRDTVKLRIIPKFAFPVGPMPDPNPCLAFEIVNNGFLPVTVSEVGFYFRGSQQRAAITSPIVVGGERWPIRLEPHSSITVYSASSELANASLRRARCAYVMTASDLVFRGSSPALKHFTRHGTIPEMQRRFSKTGLPGYVTIEDFADRS